MKTIYILWPTRDDRQRGRDPIEVYPRSNTQKSAAAAEQCRGRNKQIVQREGDCRMSLSYGNRSTSAVSKPSPFAPIFTRLHGIEVYGSHDYDLLHWNCMYQPLEKHGGIEALLLFALA